MHMATFKSLVCLSAVVITGLIAGSYWGSPEHSPALAAGPATGTVATASRQLESFRLKGGFFEAHCLSCHEGEEPAGGLDLAALKLNLDDPDQFSQWLRVHDRIASGEMPPATETQPAPREVEQVTSTLSKLLMQADVSRIERDGRTGMRRLSRVEFEWTLRDLLGIPGFSIQNALPVDGKSHGFDRSSDALDYSFIHADAYLAAVDAALDAATPEFVEQPPVFKYHWIPWDPERHSNPIAILVKSKEALGLIGLERDETFVAEYPKIIDDDPKATAVGIFRHGDADFQNRVTGFAPTLTGFHRIRVSGYSFDWDTKKVVPTDRHGALSFGIQSLGTDYGLVDLPPNVAGVSEIMAWLPRGGGMTGGLNDFLYFTSESCERQRDYGHNKPEVLGPPRPAPGVAVEWIDIEGPIYDSWPPASQIAMFGNLPVREWKKESATPFPVQRVWKSGKHPTHMPKDIYGNKNQLRPIVEVVSEKPQADAKRLLQAFLPRAYRRAITSTDLIRSMKVFNAKLAAGEHFQDALKSAYRDALSSPDFLMLGGRGPNYDLANRLSYFLWSSIPDEELLALAKKGELSKPGVLRAQAERMLSDPKSARFVENFSSQWLRQDEIDATQPDLKLYPEFSPLLQRSMLEETRAYFEELVRTDAGIVALVKSDFAMLNEPLARLYGIEGVKGHHFRRVELPADSPRGPFMAQGSVLKITANGTTTSPVTRGAFVMEKLLGIVPTPPPPGIGSIEPDTRGATTIRDQLAKHKHSPSCASCHVIMDPYGFAMESFDVVGGFRTQYRASGAGKDRPVVQGHPIQYHFDKPVDCTGQLPNGQAFQDLLELQELLVEEETTLARAYVGHLVTYATGSSIGFADRTDVKEILMKSKSHQFGLRTLLIETVCSPIFSKR